MFESSYRSCQAEWVPETTPQAGGLSRKELRPAEFPQAICITGYKPSALMIGRLMSQPEMQHAMMTNAMAFPKRNTEAPLHRVGA